MAAKVFAVETDPRVEAVKEVLPGANCGACGYAGCVILLKQLPAEKRKPNGCIPGGEETAMAIG
jgi:Na+-translocating ferredoxin:NAD+ oxidoreductase RNF subunit RnfB